MTRDDVTRDDVTRDGPTCDGLTYDDDLTCDDEVLHRRRQGRGAVRRHRRAGAPAGAGHRGARTP
ncbi:hypothetical protein AB0957_06560 [Streptomyces zhihengii]|uniref:hypothetical protein n=1 Tax=Streptomyces zhihengii TaxID=1818004 RepID=UPI0034533BCF